MWRASHSSVALWLRILLWMIVLLVPGGVLALPLLVAHARKAASRTTGDAIAPASARLIERLNQA